MTQFDRIVNLAGSPHLPPYAAKVLMNWESYAPHQQAEFVRHFEARVKAGRDVQYQPVGDPAPPEPASLVNSIRERAGLPPIEVEPSHKLRQTPQAPTVTSEGVPAPPSLIDAIQQNRKGGRR